jgi:hypothetical protein
MRVYYFGVKSPSRSKTYIYYNSNKTFISKKGIFSEKNPNNDRPLLLTSTYGEVESVADLGPVHKDIICLLVGDGMLKKVYNNGYTITIKLKCAPKSVIIGEHEKMMLRYEDGTCQNISIYGAPDKKTIEIPFVTCHMLTRMQQKII